CVQQGRSCARRRPFAFRGRPRFGCNGRGLNGSYQRDSSSGESNSRMSIFLIAALLQASPALPPRAALENPAVVSTVPKNVKKDYDKIWLRFVAANDDAKIVKDLDKLLKKQKTFDPALTIKAYIDLYKDNHDGARQNFTQALSLNPKNRIALYYLAEMAYARDEYASAADFYSRLLSIDTSHPELETKQQRALLLATDELVRAAARAESEDRLADAEQYYRQSLGLAPNEPALHARLADLLAREGKKEEAEAEKKIVDALSPKPA